MNDPTALLARLDAIGRSLSQDDDALALLGLGSAGRDTARLDAYSDLDYFVIARPGAAPRFLERLDWLERVAPLTFVFRNGDAGLHVLFEDGIYVESAVFDIDQLATAVYEPGRLIWRRDGVPETIATPTRPLPAPSSPSPERVLGQLLGNLYVGLSRYRRGERLAAAREIFVYALDRLLALAPLLEPEQEGGGDPFAPARRFEQRFPQMAAQLSVFHQGYDRVPASAAAMLDYLAAHFPLNEAMVGAIRELL